VATGGLRGGGGGGVGGGEKCLELVKLFVLIGRGAWSRCLGAGRKADERGIGKGRGENRTGGVEPENERERTETVTNQT